MVETLSRGMQFMIFGWLVLQLTNDSSSKLGVMVFMYGLPNLILILLGGAIADRVNRKQLVVVCLFVTVIVVSILGILVVKDSVIVLHIYATSFSLGVLQALIMPTRMALIGDLVDSEEVLNAVALNAALSTTTRMIGPGIAGVIIQLSGIGIALFTSCILYLGSMLCFLKIGSVLYRRPEHPKSIFKDIIAGVRYTTSVPIIAIITLVIGPVSGLFVFPYLQTMPGFAKEVLDSSASQAGFLLTASAIGAFSGNIFLAWLGDRLPKTFLLIGMLIGFGISLLLFAWTPWYWASWGLMILAGLTGFGYLSVATTILQMVVPVQLRGRVMGMWNVSTALTFIGTLPMGIAAEVFDWSTAVGSGAAIYLIIILWQTVWSPTLRHFKI